MAKRTISSIADNKVMEELRDKKAWRILAVHPPPQGDEPTKPCSGLSTDLKQSTSYIEGGALRGSSAASHSGRLRLRVE